MFHFMQRHCIELCACLSMCNLVLCCSNLFSSGSNDKTSSFPGRRNTNKYNQTNGNALMSVSPPPSQGNYCYQGNNNNTNNNGSGNNKAEVVSGKLVNIYMTIMIR